ncbi:sucrose-phosphate phosphatase [Phormidium sp. CCY1219]|uniref:sucrose-phosphate phosphatase n=1 Tax=Phormidium sp. CCY1219 TaxID=2886104 RepID=UPI002D1F99C4|nr:sucrose-phosphate phosphatase [Phormidium sp. CCY1219]MEB3826445.1 sucrose-phosphate phosphatase [Phormidium sp. CCY1219]
MSQFLFVSDLDNTYVGDDEALGKLQQQLEQQRQEHGSKIVYSTGRSPQLYKQLQEEKQLITPDALVTSVGTEIYIDSSDSYDTEWAEILSKGWDREQVVATAGHFSDLVPQPDSEQRPFKASYFLSEEAAQELLPRLESALKERDLEVKVIYSGSQDLDILPNGGNKGKAMQFLAKRYGMPPERTVACGDSGNDIALFAVGDERGIIVGNAKPELREWYDRNKSESLYMARSACAAGILEGLKHFGFIEGSA